MNEELRELWLPKIVTGSRPQWGVQWDERKEALNNAYLVGQHEAEATLTNRIPSRGDDRSVQKRFPTNRKVEATLIVITSCQDLRRQKTSRYAIEPISDAWSKLTGPRCRAGEPMDDAHHKSDELI